MKNIEEVLWKFLGEYLQIEILPKGWENFELSDVKHFCTTIVGCLRIVNDIWYAGSTAIDTSRIFRINWSSEVRLVLSTN